MPSCLVVPPSTQAGALWRWLHDTAAMLGMIPPTSFTLEGRAESKQLWGNGVEGTPEASDVHVHTSWH